jgi:hypothetical protein
VHFNQPDAHKGQVARHAFAVGQLGAVNQVKHGRTAIFNLLNPLLLHIAQSPNIVELSAPGLAVQGRGVTLVGVERRVKVD